MGFQHPGNMMRIRKKGEKQQLQTMLLVKQTQQENNSSTQLLIFDEQIVFKTVIVKNDSEKYNKKSIQYNIFQIHSGF